jgi:hypothetical protein
MQEEMSIRWIKHFGEEFSLRTMLHLHIEVNCRRPAIQYGISFKEDVAALDYSILNANVVFT